MDTRTNDSGWVSLILFVCCRTKDKAKAKSCKCHSCIWDFLPVLTTSGDMLIFCQVKKCCKAAGSSFCFPCWELTGVLIVKLYWFILILIHEGKHTNGDEFYILLSFNFSNELYDSEQAEFDYLGHCDFIFICLKTLLFYVWEDDCTETFLLGLWWIIPLSAGSWQISKEIPKFAPFLLITN